MSIYLKPKTNIIFNGEKLDALPGVEVRIILEVLDGSVRQSKEIKSIHIKKEE